MSPGSGRYHFGSAKHRCDARTLTIKRFATRENRCRRKSKEAKSTYRWRSYRLRAVGVYESRFERVPEIFRNRKLPQMRSYYVRDGRYVWPEHGEPGKLVIPKSQ